jgi:hypothetical protein
MPMRFFPWRIRGRRAHRPAPLQGEEYEVARSEAATQQERDRYTARLFRNIGNLSLPFLKDPFD